MTNVIKEAKVLYNAKGKKSHVLLPYKAYEKLLEYLEDWEDLRAMKAVEHEKSIPWEEAKKILQRRNK